MTTNTCGGGVFRNEKESIRKIFFKSISDADSKFVEFMVVREAFFFFIYFFTASEFKNTCCFLDTTCIQSSFAHEELIQSYAATQTEPKSSLSVSLPFQENKTPLLTEAKGSQNFSTYF